LQQWVLYDAPFNADAQPNTGDKVFFKIMVYENNNAMGFSQA